MLTARRSTRPLSNASLVLGFRAAAAGAGAAAAPAAGVRAGREAIHGQPPPFSLDPDLTFIEMATEQRRVVDFLCQACHRVSEKGGGFLEVSAKERKTQDARVCVQVQE